MKFWRRLVLFLKRRELDRELDEEIRFHMEMKTEANCKAGMAEADARMAAARSFGNRTLASEETRAFWGWAWLERLGQDLRYAVRTLRSNPAFTAVAVLTLALGIGANTAVFTLVNGLILQSVPVPHPEELVYLQLRLNNGNDRVQFSYPFYKDLRERNTVLSGVAAWWGQSAAVSWHGVTEHVQGITVTGDYFRVLGARPAVGRLILPDDDRASGASPVCVLGNRLWMQRFGGDPSIVGSTILLNAVPFTVIGVAAEGFTGSEPGIEPEFYAPLSMFAALNHGDDFMLTSRQSEWLQVFGRRKPGISMEQARQSIQSTVDGIGREIFHGDRGVVSVVPGNQGRGWRRDMVQQPCLTLAAMTVLVLLIACANVASLLVARGVARRREMAVRIAIGAGRPRIVRQLMTESMLLALLGAICGIPVAAAGMRLMRALAPSIGGGLSLETSPDWTVLGFLAAAVGLTTLLFGLVPALSTSHVEAMPAMKDLPASSGRRLTVRRALVVAQVALSVVVLTAAGLFVSSLARIRAVDSGMRTENVVIAMFNPSLNGYEQAKTRAFFSLVLDRIRAIGGVRAASLAAIAPLSGADLWRNDALPEGYHGERLRTRINSVSPEYFRTMGIPLLAGRDFDESDRPGSPRNAVVSEAFAQRFWPGQNALGKRIEWLDSRSSVVVTGVVRQHKYTSLQETPQWIVYTPLAQGVPYMSCSDACEGDAVLTVRTVGDPVAAVAAIRAGIRALDPNLPVYKVKTMTTVVEESLVSERLMAALSGVFGALALILVAVGLYGVIAYSVARRTREIGVRIALGAAAGDVLRLVLRESAGTVGLGLLLGLPAAWWAARAIGNSLYGVSPHEPAVYAAVLVVLMIVMLAAAYVPARRATHIEPTRALRFE